MTTQELYETIVMDSNSEFLWAEALNEVILKYEGGGIRNSDLAGWVTKWFHEGLTPQQAFHKWITLHYL